MKEGADAAGDADLIHEDCTVDADDVLAILIPAVVVSVSGDLLAETVCYALVWVVGVDEKEAVG